MIMMNVSTSASITSIISAKNSVILDLIDKSYSSSLSTQPTPQTVWISFFGQPLSILRRR